MTTIANDQPEFEGELVRIGRKEFVVPSLSVKQARKLWPQILELDKGITPENLPEKYELAIPIIHAALSRNYPDVTVEQVEEMVDVKLLRKLLLIVSGQSGMATAGEIRPAVGTGDAPIVH